MWRNYFCFQLGVGGWVRGAQQSAGGVCVYVPSDLMAAGDAGTKFGVSVGSTTPKEAPFGFFEGGVVFLAPKMGLSEKFSFSGPPSAQPHPQIKYLCVPAPPK